jgi:uncharacterized membrane protein
MVSAMSHRGFLLFFLGLLLGFLSEAYRRQGQQGFMAQD